MANELVNSLETVLPKSPPVSRSTEMRVSPARQAIPVLYPKSMRAPIATALSNQPSMTDEGHAELSKGVYAALQQEI
jgi:hypothetical protein